MKKKHTGPQTVAKLRQADVLIGRGKNVPEVCKETEVSEHTYYLWRRKYGGTSPDMIKQLSPWENGYVESFNEKLRDELLNRELFVHIDELRYVVDRWRMDYNHYRPHSSLGYMSPAAFAASCLGRDSATLRQPQDKDNESNPLIEAGT